MRWDDQLLKPPDGETVELPLFNQNAVVRRFYTPEFAGMAFYEVQAKSIINHLAHERFGFRHTINPYRGCSHACVYCFARPTHTYLDFDAGRDFETKIVVKTNAPELLRKELRGRSWSGEHIAMGTNTDNYQRAEGRYRLMRGILSELNAARNPYSILTKSTLIQRDLDLLVEGAKVTDVSTAFSVGTIDEEVWQKSEPGTPHPLKRLEVVRRLNEAGVRCGVLMAPILPGISDSPEQLKATVDAVAAAGAASITPITLYLRPGFREEFMLWLSDAYPELVTDYGRMYRTSNAPKPVTQAIQQRVERLKGAHSWQYRPRPDSHRTASPKKGRKSAGNLQLSLGLEQ
ncbi:MAG: radical SAM protein [Actinomycetota bacterium]